MRQWKHQLEQQKHLLPNFATVQLETREGLMAIQATHGSPRVAGESTLHQLADAPLWTRARHSPKYLQISPPSRKYMKCGSSSEQFYPHLPVATPICQRWWGAVNGINIGFTKSRESSQCCLFRWVLSSTQIGFSEMMLIRKTRNKSTDLYPLTCVFILCTVQSTSVKKVWKEIVPASTQVPIPIITSCSI